MDQVTESFELDLFLDVTCRGGDKQVPVRYKRSREQAKPRPCLIDDGDLRG